MQYEYDTYGNMTDREDGISGIAEDFEYDDLNRLVSTPAGSVTYDGKGNITALDGAGGFGYASSRPYALSQISLSVSAFPTAEQHITFNAMNRPDTISERGTVACLKYFEDGERSQMTVAGSDHNITKYSSNSNYGVVDNIIGLQLEDDAAYVNWGAEWRMPGTAQMDEMMENCTSDWIKVNGMGGYLLKSNTNNAAIFFPAGGWYNSNGHKGFESDGTYWSRFNAYSTMPNLALLLSFRFGNMGWINVTAFGRQYGANVRAVHVAQE